MHANRRSSFTSAMSSPLKIPPNTDPERDKDYRFRTNGTACEWGESYHPGGYHPVHLQDIFNTQYRVIRKLGYGSYSTVWLAIDLRSSRYVALKISTANFDQEAASREILLHNRLAKSPTNITDFRYVVPLLDSFYHYGPNGTHLCLVFEPMGPNINSVVRLSPQCQIGEPWERRLPKHWAKRILRDVLLGLQFLNANSIIHGDLHAGNILFTIRQSDINSNPPENLQQRPDQGASLRRLDDKPDPWAPKYLLEPKSLYDYISFEEDPLVKIIDLGAASLEESPPTLTVTPAALRAPELILNGKLGRGLDVWNFGCLAFEFITGHPLFNVLGLEGNRFDETTNDEHLIQVTEMLQPLPEALFGKWRRANIYYGSNGERLDVQEEVYNSDKESNGERIDTQDDRSGVGGEDWDDQSDASSSTEEVPLASSRRYNSLVERFRAVKPADISEREEEEILQLIRLALQPDATKRAVAAELLQQPWFYE